MLSAFGFGSPTTSTFWLGRIVVEFAFGTCPVAFVDGVGGTELAVGSGDGVGNGRRESMDTGGTRERKRGMRTVWRQAHIVEGHAGGVPL